MPRPLAPRHLARLLTVALLAWAGCTTPGAPARAGAGTHPTHAASGAPAASARVVRAHTELPGGPSARGEVGDLVLENALARFVVEAAGPGQGFARTGGSIIDAARRGHPDLIDQTFGYLDDTFPRQPLYRTVVVADAGGPGRTAVVRAAGVDSDDPKIALVTEYRLAPSSPALTIVTTLTNHGTAPVADYELGDAIQWGRTTHFAPGAGTAISNEVVHVPWIAAIGRGTSYGWVVPGHAIRARSGTSWSDPIGRTVTLAPGTKVTYTRRLVVGTGDVASLLPAILGADGTAHGRVEGRLVSGGKPLGGEVRVLGAAGHPFATVDAGADGRFAAVLPPGRYRLEGRLPGRVSDAIASITVRAGSVAHATVSVSAESRLSVTVVERSPSGAAHAVPARITLEGLGDTRAPDLGPVFRARGAGPYVFLAHGRGTIPLAPGHYRVYASRGIEYGLAHADVTLGTGATREAHLSLVREVDTRGWMGADLHQHGRASFDSAVDVRDRIVSDACEGVEIVATSDHDVITDARPVVRALGLGADVFTVPGVEATSPTVGHFSCFPMTPKPGAPGGGAPPSHHVAPARIFAACRADPAHPLVEVNHPFYGDGGYFRLTGFDPAKGAVVPGKRPPWAVYDPHYDLLEILNGKRGATDEATLRAWFSLLSHGYRYTGTANSDSHTLVGDEAGYPRTYVRVGLDDPARMTAGALVHALRARAAIGTNGPFVTLAAGGTGIGGTVHLARPGKLALTATVQAADWVSVKTLTIVVDGGAALTVPLDPNRKGSVRYHGVLEVPIARSGWIVAVVRGDRSLAPVEIGTAGKKTVHALAFTNPIFVEVPGAKPAGH